MPSSAKTSLLRGLQQPLVLRISKQSAGVDHKFSCDGVACEGHQTVLDHLDFTKTFTFIDETSVPFSGLVSIADTAVHNDGKPCYLSGVRVCLLHHSESAQKLACGETEESGRYTIPALIGLHVSLSFEYLDHTFTRQILGDKPSYYSISRLPADQCTSLLRTHDGTL